MKSASEALINLLAGSNQYVMFEFVTITLSDGSQLAYSTTGGSVLADFQALVQASSPLVYWKLDEAAGATVAADSGTLGLPLTANASLTTFGLPSLCGGSGKSTELKASGANPWVAAHNDALNFGAGDFTFLAIVQISSSLADRSDIVCLLETNVTWLEWAFIVNSSGRIALELNTSNASGTVQTIGGTGPSVATGSPQLVIARKTGTAVELFVNRTLAGSGTFAGTLWASPSPIGMGCGPWAPGANPSLGLLPGGKDSVAIWDRSVTNAEIAAFIGALPWLNP
jgi:Concanavalin A-like lectin/glucanases superfamily